MVLVQIAAAVGVYCILWLTGEENEASDKGLLSIARNVQCDRKRVGKTVIEAASPNHAICY